MMCVLSRRILWWTERWATAKAAHSSLDCCLCRYILVGAPPTPVYNQRHICLWQVVVCKWPPHLHPDARRGGVLRVCASDAGVSSEGTVQTQHGRAGPLHLPVRISATGKEHGAAVSVSTIRGQHVIRFYLQFLFSLLEFIWGLKRCSSVTTGATSRAQCSFPVPEFPHIHVRLVLVPHSVPHIPPAACRHSHLWYFYVWGKNSV